MRVEVLPHSTLNARLSIFAAGPAGAVTLHESGGNRFLQVSAPLSYQSPLAIAAISSTTSTAAVTHQYHLIPTRRCGALPNSFATNSS